MIKGKEIFHEILTRVIGFLIFLVLLGIVNILTYYIKNEIFLSVVGFLNSNIWLIIIFSIIFLIGEIFGYLMFPLNIPGPLFNAVGGVLLIQFVFSLFSFITKTSNVEVNLPLGIIQNFVMIMVFIIVLIVGYVHIIIDATRPRKRIHSERKEKRHKSEEEN
jgi:hypothetical protein